MLPRPDSSPHELKLAVWWDEGDHTVGLIRPQVHTLQHTALMSCQYTVWSAAHRLCAQTCSSHEARFVTVRPTVRATASAAAMHALVTLCLCHELRHRHYTSDNQVCA